MTHRIEVSMYRFAVLLSVLVTLTTPALAKDKACFDYLTSADRRAVMEKAAEIFGHPVDGTFQLSTEADLAQGEKTLALLEWINQSFGLRIKKLEEIRTVDELLRSMSEKVTPERPAPEAWTQFTGREGTFTIPEGKDVLRVFLEQASANPDQVIVADDIQGVKTYRDIVVGILALKTHFERIPGKRVAVLLPPGVTAATTYLALLFAGKEPVMINYTMGDELVRASLDSVDTEYILAARQFVQKLEDKNLSYASLTERMIMMEDIKEKISPLQKIRAKILSYVSWASLWKARAGQDSVILFTSGSTGIPKAVPLTHENQLTNLRDLSQVLPLSNQSRIIGFLPPFHSFGHTGTILMALCSGIPAHYYPDTTGFKEIVERVHQYQPNVILGTPTFLRFIFLSAKRDAYKLRSLEVAITGGEGLPPDVVELIHSVNPRIKILQGYGLTETSPVVTINPLSDPRTDMLGQVLPSLEYAVVDIESKERLPMGEDGLLLVRGPSVFRGYLNTDESPFIEFEGELWFNTGDVVTEFADRWLKYVTRLKRMPKIGGEYVSLPAMEEALLKSKVVAPNSDGSPALAIQSGGDNTPIVLFTTADVQLSEVNRVLTEAGLPTVARVKEIRKVDAIPVLGTGKIDYKVFEKALKEEAAARGSK